MNPENIDDKIIIYERQVKGWFLQPTLKMVKYKPEHKGFLVLMSCISYFEGVEQYKTGITSNGNSKRAYKCHTQTLSKINLMNIKLQDYIIKQDVDYFMMAWLKDK